mmetsp:Transcript_15986/g.51631  ORF Transcript_15986/g.51631 Transcript_15986/m.51631 type:complete len:230 (-) Transcript_15986:1407-2096(-)
MSGTFEVSNTSLRELYRSLCSCAHRPSWRCGVSPLAAECLAGAATLEESLPDETATSREGTRGMPMLDAPPPALLLARSSRTSSSTSWCSRSSAWRGAFAFSLSQAERRESEARPPSAAVEGACATIWPCSSPRSSPRGCLLLGEGGRDDSCAAMAPAVVCGQLSSREMTAFDLSMPRRPCSFVSSSMAVADLSLETSEARMGGRAPSRSRKPLVKAAAVVCTRPSSEE